MGKEKGLSKIIWLAVAAAILYVVWFNFDKFVLSQNYEFYVESPCDPAEETCYVRDCEDYCPPNGMAVYKVWMISAADFDECADDTCEAECESGAITCEPVPCDSEEADCSDTGGEEEGAEEDAEEAGESEAETE